MRYLVIGENIDAGYLLPPDHVAAAVEGAVIPSFRILAKLEQEGRLWGGLFPGERGGAFVLDVESPEQLNQVVGELPFSGLVKWQVKALIDFNTGADQAAQAMQLMKRMSQQGG